MSKFWSPTGSEGTKTWRVRLGAITFLSDPDPSEAKISFDYGQGNLDGYDATIRYPTLEARDADYSRLCAALEAE